MGRIHHWSEWAGFGARTRLARLSSTDPDGGVAKTGRHVFTGLPRRSDGTPVQQGVSRGNTGRHRLGNAPEDSEARLRRTRVFGEEEWRRKMGVAIQRHPDLVQQRSGGPDCYLQTAIMRRYGLKFVCRRNPSNLTILS